MLPQVANGLASGRQQTEAHKSLENEEKGFKKPAANLSKHRLLKNIDFDIIGALHELLRIHL